MSLIDRWKAPTPRFFKNVIKVCLTLAAGAGALLMADTLGKAVMPGFEFKLLPAVTVVCKNVVAFGFAVAAMSKFAKENKTKDDE